MDYIDISHLHKTDQMMAEDQFWHLVDDSLKNSVYEDKQEVYLVEKLSKLSPLEMIGFFLKTMKLFYQSYRNDLWFAGYIMNGGCSDSGFERFRYWLISKGKSVYYKALYNPDTLI